MHIVTYSLLKTLAEKNFPVCLSLYFPTHSTGQEKEQDRLRLKNLLQAADAELEERYELSSGQRDQWLAPARELLDRSTYWQDMSEGLGIFMAPDFCLTVRLPEEPPETMILSDKFHVTPLLPGLQNQQRYYILALSQHNVRLLAAYDHTAQSVALDLSHDHLRGMMDLEKQEATLQHHTVAGGTEFHGQGGIKDHRKDEIILMLRHVDQEVSALLHGETAPLVVMAAEPTGSLYREICSYPHLADLTVDGSPDGLSDYEIQQKTWQQMQPLLAKNIDRELERYAEREQPVEDIPAAVVSAAYEGKIEILFVRKESTLPGVFNPKSNDVEVHDERQPDDEDLIETAAVHTILNSGRVLALTPDKMPSEEKMAALLRYQNT